MFAAPRHIRFIREIGIEDVLLVAGKRAPLNPRAALKTTLSALDLERRLARVLP
jgi:hypothetical protein